MPTSVPRAAPPRIPPPAVLPIVQMEHSEILALRRLFPASERHVYLNHAGVAPTSTRARDAAVAWLDGAVADGVLSEPTWEALTERARAAAARLVGASPDEIAFVRNTSHGLALFAEGYDWRPGDEVAVATSVEYPSNVYPWQHLASRGVAVREIAAPRLGVEVGEVGRALGPRTRVVAVSSCQYASGFTTDLDALGALCRERGVDLCVDGIQTVGAFATDVKRSGVGFLSADSHKWMLGINGVGFAFVDRALLPRLRPPAVGWKSTKDAWNFDRATFDLRDDASRLEEGSPAYVAIHAMGAALELLLEIGVERISARITALLDRAADGLSALGAQVGPERRHRSGILTFTPRGGDARGLYERLGKERVVASLRRGAVRVSPHVTTLESDIDHLLDVVRRHGG